MRLCSKCLIEKDESEFWKCLKIKDGLSKQCRQCQLAYQKEYYQSHPNRKSSNVRSSTKRLIAVKKLAFQYLLSHPCVDCGEADPVVLEFDHVRGNKLYSVSYMVGQSFSWVKVLTEIDKCEVRCSNCHKRKTAKQFGWYAFLDEIPHLA